jgi:hypothetical protein
MGKHKKILILSLSSPLKRSEFTSRRIFCINKYTQHKFQMRKQDAELAHMRNAATHGFPRELPLTLSTTLFTV